MFGLFSLTSFLSRWERRQDRTRPDKGARAENRARKTDSLSQRERVRVRENAT
jgi:hypothetical protein